MTVKEDIVLWDDGNSRFCLFAVPDKQQYQYINDMPCVTFGVSYENANFKGFDIFTLFDHFYIDVLNAAQEMHYNLNGSFCIKDSGADTDSHIDFTMVNGRLSVGGRLGASFSTHSLQFKFKADQTLLCLLIQNLKI